MLLILEAQEAGTDAGMAVAAGRLTPEEAGTMWVAYADASHEAGVEFNRAYGIASRTAREARA